MNLSSSINACSKYRAQNLLGNVYLSNTKERKSEGKERQKKRMCFNTGRNNHPTSLKEEQEEASTTLKNNKSLPHVAILLHD